MEDGAAAAKREAVKSQKYAGEVDMWGRSSNCIALVFEHFGRWGHDALQFLNRLSILSTDEDGRKNSREFKTYWRRCFSIALQRSNANVISRISGRAGQFKNSLNVDEAFVNYK